MKCKIPQSVHFLPVDLPVAFPAVLTCPQKLPSFITCDPLHFQFHDCCLLLFCPFHGTLYLEQEELHFSSGDFILLPELTLYALSYAPENYLFFAPASLLPGVSLSAPSPSTLMQAASKSAPAVPLSTSSLFSHAPTTSPSISLPSTPTQAASKVTPAFPLSTSTPAVLSREASPSLFLLAEQFFKEIQRKQPYYQDVAKGLLLSLLSSFSTCAFRPFSETCSPSPATPYSSSQASCSSSLDWFYSSLRYMQSNYAKPITIPEVAKNCCDLSPSQFRKKFAVLTGTSPLSYLQRFRIRAACRELYLREKSIGEIAADCGFPTLSCFHRQFQEQMHCSPSAWLARYSQS